MAVVYDNHLQAVTNSFIRKGTVSPGTKNLTPVEIDVLDGLETFTRDGLNDHLSDMESGAFSATFLSLARRVFFEEYIEYKKVYQEVSLDTWLDDVKQVLQDRGVPFAEDREYTPIDYNPDPAPLVAVDVEEALLESDISYSIEPEDRPINHPVLYSECYGVSPDGYDKWVIDLTEVEGLSFDELDDPEGATEDIEPQLLTDPLDVDDDGYDVWVRVIPAASDDFMSELLNYTPVKELLTEPYDTDTDGYDIWVNPQTTVSAAEEEAVSDGWVGTDALDKGIGELYTEPYSTGKDGYDVWVAPTTGADTAEERKDSATDVLLTEPYGISSDGYDIWKKPANTLTSGVTQSTQPPAGVSPSPQPAMNVSSNTQSLGASATYRPRTSEDATVEAAEKFTRSLIRAGKRFTSFMIR